MIWLTWRQFRAQATAAAAALIALAIALAVTGPHVAHLYDLNKVGTCQANSDCQAMVTFFMEELNAGYVKGLYIFVVAVVLLAPAIIGIFWGAPLIAREVETGTFRLAWNQSVTRARWTVVKLTALGLVSMAVSGLLSLMLAVWASPINHAAGLVASPPASVFTVGRFQPLIFATTGVAPIGYAAFAFALGVAVGLLLRRTVPAMAITLAVFAAVQIVMPSWVRPHLITPAHLTRAFDGNNLTQLVTSGNGQNITVTESINLPGAWLLSNQTITTTGQAYSGPPPQACTGRTGTIQACANALGRLHLRQYVTYQPASRYWDFQWLELGIFIALAVLLAGSVFWMIRRRLS